MENGKQPLLSLGAVTRSGDEFEAHSSGHDEPPAFAAGGLFFAHGTEDIAPVKDARDFVREFSSESKRLWSLAGPAVFTSVCQFLVNFVPIVFAGHINTLTLAGNSIGNMVVCGFVYSIMMGMGSALETPYGQAFGAGELDMLGIYMQRSWVILNSIAIILFPVYLFAGPILRLIGQTKQIAGAAEEFAVWTVPLLFAYAFNFPIQKFLQAQSRVMAMAVISAAVLVFHVFFCWLLMLRLRWGIAGAAVALDICWWLTVLAQFVYIVGGSCGRAWTGSSLKAFQNLCGFLRLSLASSLMICLDLWYYVALLLIAGYLKDAQVSVGALSICMSIMEFALMVAVGFLTAVRVSNEIRAGHPRTAKFLVSMTVITSALPGLAISIILLALREDYPSLFSNDTYVKDLTPLLAACILVNMVQPVLSGAAIGVGWQEAVAYMNVACYYVFGIPLGLLIGHKFKWGVKGIWLGMLCGTIVQTVVLLVMVYKANWGKETLMADDRIRRWAGVGEDSEPGEREIAER